MIIDISGILKELGGRMPLECELDLSGAEFLGEKYSFEKPVKVNGSVSNNGKSFILSAKCSAEVKTRCARCLKEITVSVDFVLDENLVRSGGEEVTDEDVIVFEGTGFELDEIVLDDFLMQVGGRYLCSEDCRGLCPKCGADLNEGDCGCSYTDIDPRWAGLLDIMNKEN
ncbi:MAG: DUF177 domain-containing protein [Clostridiales bacterium]|nr:DUF177 domain-containing protein [Clostridiales bacterium]